MACVNVCMKVHMPLNTQRAKEKTGYPTLSLSNIFLWVRVSSWTSCAYSHGSGDISAYAEASGSLHGFWRAKLVSSCLYKCSHPPPPKSLSPALEHEFNISWCLCNKYYETIYWSIQKLWYPPVMSNGRQNLIKLRWWESLAFKEYQYIISKIKKKINDRMSMFSLEIKRKTQNKQLWNIRF